MPQEQETSATFSGMVGRALLLPLRAVAYLFNPSRIILHAGMSRNSRELGMQFLEIESGCVAFSIPERLAGKMDKQEKINDLQNARPNIKINKENKMVLIEIDTPGIQKDLDPKKNKIFIRDKIEEEIHSNLKALIKVTGDSDGKTAYGDRKLIKSIAKLLYNNHNYTDSKEGEIFASGNRSIIVCIANKGVISLDGQSQVQNGRKANQPSSKPVTNMSDIELNDFRVNQI